MDKSYLTDYTESIEELSESFEFLVANSTVRSKAKPEGFYSTGQGIVSKNFYVGNNLTEGLISIDIKNSDSCILSIPKTGRYKVTVSEKITKKCSPKAGAIILPSPHICYEAITNEVDDLIVIMEMKRLKTILINNYSYKANSLPTSVIRIKKKNKKVLSIINLIESTLETAKNFPHLRASLLIKSNIEEILALYVADIIAEALKLTFNLKHTSPDIDLVLKAEELIATKPEAYFTILDIADHIFTSPRNLQMAFKKHRSYSPMHFLKEKKFHKARKLLLNGVSGSKIKSVALSVGILDLNRFGMNYKEFFGELPSETLKNNRD